MSISKLSEWHKRPALCLTYKQDEGKIPSIILSVSLSLSALKCNVSCPTWCDVIRHNASQSEGAVFEYLRTQSYIQKLALCTRFGFAEDVVTLTIINMAFVIKRPQ
jgi:hypothetical protein